MKYEVIDLSKQTNVKIPNNVKLEIYLSENTPEIDYKQGKPALLIAPGGGYVWCSRREGEPIALRYMSEGFNCFVLSYTNKVPYPTPHLEVALAMEYIYKNAEQFNINKNFISIIGFSAGGHLCASYGYIYKEIAKEYNLDEKIIKPFSIVLGYPVISVKENTHNGTAQTITNNFQSDLVEKMHIPQHIDSTYPPTFIWTTKGDHAVPPINSYLLKEQLDKNKVKNDFIIFENGEHGLSLSNYGVYGPAIFSYIVKENQCWVNKSVDFVFNLIENK